MSRVEASQRDGVAENPSMGAVRRAGGQSLREREKKLTEKAKILERIRELEGELAWRKKNRAIDYYTVKKDALGIWQASGMNRPQEQFHRDKHKVRILS